jgi:hypothetical protein
MTITSTTKTYIPPIYTTRVHKIRICIHVSTKKSIKNYTRPSQCLNTSFSKPLRKDEYWIKNHFRFQLFDRLNLEMNFSGFKSSVLRFIERVGFFWFIGNLLSDIGFLQSQNSDDDHMNRWIKVLQPKWRSGHYSSNNFWIKQADVITIHHY